MAVRPGAVVQARRVLFAVGCALLLVAGVRVWWQPPAKPGEGSGAQIELRSGRSVERGSDRPIAAGGAGEAPVTTSAPDRSATEPVLAPPAPRPHGPDREAPPVTVAPQPIALAAGPPPGGSPAWKDSVAAAILAERHDFTDPAVRASVVARLAEAAAAEDAYLQVTAQALGLQLRTPGGAELVGFHGLEPLYERPDNANAAITTAADRVRQTAPYNLDGQGYTIGLWESSGLPLQQHTELVNRITVVDSPDVSSHATHVAGTLIAWGHNASIRGMAPRARILGYRSTNDAVKMASVAMAQPREPGMLQVSNHSYGASAGWESGTDASGNSVRVWYGTFSDDGNPANDFAPRFGQYDSSSAAWDGVVWNAPYYLPFKSAGNHRNDAPPSAGTTWRLNSGTGTARSYDPASHPRADNTNRSGRSGLIPHPGFELTTNKVNSKNVVAVGAVNDAVTSGNRDLAKATLSSFTSFGPTDDGRIKPDIVANGVSLTSAGIASTTATSSSSGTSMATPNAAGSALLLVQLFERERPGESLLASTLKALILHTADDLGRPGPDFEFGWGLMNTQAAADLILDHVAGFGGGRLWEGVLPAASPSIIIPVQVEAGTVPLCVTLCWTDPPGTASTAHNNRTPRLVHDLNLRVVAPDGTTLLPWMMPYADDPENDALLVAPAVRGVNRVDNVEQVLSPPGVPAGIYEVHVDVAGALSQGNQRYSLAVTGGILPKGFARWAWEQLGLTVVGDAVAGLAANPDGRGPLGLRYAFGDQAAAHAGTLVFQPNGLPALLYPVDTRLNDIRIRVEGSADLSSWSAIESEPVSTSGSIETHRALVTDSAIRFLRLRVSVVD